jgi:hypothetical protein
MIQAAFLLKPLHGFVGGYLAVPETDSDSFKKIDC